MSNSDDRPESSKISDGSEKNPPEKNMSPQEVSRRDNRQFNADMQGLLDAAEDMRLTAMKNQRTRGFIAMSAGLAFVILGATGFGWFLLVKAQILRAVGSIALGLVFAVALNIWSMRSLSQYKHDYKAKFLPRMAKLLGGFQYHPARGISQKLLSKTGIMPAFDLYKAEDCFMGNYKGVKVLFSEAKLLHKKAYRDSIFNGIFVLLEVPEGLIDGHTIVSANKEMISKWRKTRWKKLQDVYVDVSDPSWDRFTILSDKPDTAQKTINERLLKELSEAADIFDDSPLSAVFFRKKFIFIMIPYDGDMFEASDIHVPITTKRHALQCKKEIEQILEIIDVFDLYNKDQPAQPTIEK